MKYLAVIPARKGSKSLPRKNIYPFNGKSLICWTIEAALKSKICDVVVTTDDPEILKVITFYEYPICIIERPDFLTEDNVPLAPVIAHALRQQTKIYDSVITLQPTSPLRTDIHIIEAVARFEMSRADSLLSVIEDYHSVWERKPSGEVIAIRERLQNRQQETALYIANGAIFITKSDILLNKINRLGGKIEIYSMDRENSLDIHTEDDIKLGEFYLQRENK